MTALVGLKADETELGAVAVGSGRVGVDGGLEETFHRSVPRLMAIGHSASLQEQLQDLENRRKIASNNRGLLLFSFWKRAESDCLHIRLTISKVLRFIHRIIYDSSTF